MKETTRLLLVVTSSSSSSHKGLDDCDENVLKGRSVDCVMESEENNEDGTEKTEEFDEGTSEERIEVDHFF